jgi:hypothetical protein
MSGCRIYCFVFKYPQQSNYNHALLIGEQHEWTLPKNE